MAQHDEPRWPGWSEGDQPAAPRPGTPPPGQYGPQSPPGAGPPRNGLGIAALILGIIGLLSGLIPLLFWLAAVLGVTALILGLVGARRAKQGYATNGRMSVVGAVLGGLAIVLAIIGAVLVGQVLDDIDRELGRTETTETAPPEEPPEEAEPDEETGEVEAEEDEADEAEAPAPDDAGPLAFGAEQLYADGLRVTVTVPQPFTPSEHARGPTPGNIAVTVEVVVVNDTDETFRADRARVVARDAEGRSAEKLYDSGAGLSDLSGTLLPGRQAVGSYAFELPPEHADTFDVEVRPSFSHQAAVWSGPAR